MSIDIVMKVSPVLRGLSFDGEKGLHVKFHPEPESSGTKPDGGETSVIAEIPEDAGAGKNLDDEAVITALRKAMQGYSGPGNYPREVRVSGAGSFTLAPSYDAAVYPPPAAGDRNESEDGAAAGPVQGKIVLVTGSAQGFGAGLARLLSEAGATVFICDLNLEGAQETADKINEDAGETRALAVKADVSDEQSVTEMVRTVVGECGGLDVLISNAGVLKAGSVKELSLRDFKFVTSVNYTGYFLCVKHFAPIMALQNEAAGVYFSDIIQINSKSGLRGSNKNGAYAGGKFGGIGLTESFALELVEDNIKVNSLCPGNFFEGPLWSDPDRGLFVQYLNAGKVPGAKTIEDVKRFYESKVPMKRGCRIEDLMKAVYYVIDQKYETGQALPVTGGQVMLH